MLIKHKAIERSSILKRSTTSQTMRYNAFKFILVEILKYYVKRKRNEISAYVCFEKN